MIGMKNVQKLTKADYPLYQAFARTHFHDKYILSDPVFFDWQFAANPYAEDYEFYILKEADTIYGSVGLIPMPYTISGDSRLVCNYVNLYVDERLRAFGAGALLIKAAMNRSDIAFIEGFNPDSFSIYEKLGDWHNMGNFNRFVYIYNAEKVNSLLPKKAQAKDMVAGDVPPLQSSSKEYVYSTEFDSQIDEFWSQVKARYQNTVERSYAYLKWRYVDHPYLDYKILVARDSQGIIVGYVIYRIEAVEEYRVARMIDFIAYEHAEQEILLVCMNELGSLEVDMLEFMFSGFMYKSTLESLGFVDVYKTVYKDLPLFFNPISYSKNYINYAVWNQDTQINQDAFHNPANWFLTKGDSDQDRPNPH